MAVGAAVLLIYLLRPHQVRGTQPGCTFGAATSSHRPLAQAVSQWSYMLLKPDLAQAAQSSSLLESAQNTGKR